MNKVLLSHETLCHVAVKRRRVKSHGMLCSEREDRQPRGWMEGGVVVVVLAEGRHRRSTWQTQCHSVVTGMLTRLSLRRCLLKLLRNYIPSIFSLQLLLRAVKASTCETCLQSLNHTSCSPHKMQIVWYPPRSFTCVCLFSCEFYQLDCAHTLLRLDCVKCIHSCALYWMKQSVSLLLVVVTGGRQQHRR